jgi:5-methylcytosine-specific restriction endonuclease McrA
MAKRPPEHIKAQKKNRKENPRCAICGTTENVQSHHLIEYCIGGSADANNFVTLCEFHHNAVHNGEITLIEIL